MFRLEAIIAQVLKQGTKKRCTPELQVSYTPELQAKLYAGVTGVLKSIRRSYRQNYTPELQVKLRNT
jgi:hypothetical protein